MLWMLNTELQFLIQFSLCHCAWKNVSNLFCWPKEMCVAQKRHNLSIELLSFNPEIENMGFFATILSNQAGLKETSRARPKINRRRLLKFLSRQPCTVWFLVNAQKNFNELSVLVCIIVLKWAIVSRKGVIGSVNMLRRQTPCEAEKMFVLKDMLSPRTGQRIFSPSGLGALWANWSFSIFWSKSAQAIWVALLS